MAESYDIHLTDPLSTAFKVRAFTSNGPAFPTSESLADGAVSASTSLLVFGKGQPNYGEKIAENILHLLENFSGSTEPQFPTSGQLWYARFTVIKTDNGFYSWTDDPNDPINGGNWNPITVDTNTIQPVIVNGGYWFDGSTLYYGIDDTSHPLSPTWLPRIFEDFPTHVGAPDPAVTKPRKELKSYDGSKWVEVDEVHASDLAPTNPSIGKLWFDKLTNQLKIYDGISFVSVADQYLLHDGTVAMTGDLNMGSHKITSLLDPTQDQDAATLKYVEDRLAAEIGNVVVVMSLDELTDVSVPAPSVGHFLKYTGAGAGSNWENSIISLSDIAGLDTPTLTVDNINHLVGTTQNIENHFAEKLDLTGGVLTGQITADVANLTPTNDEYVTAAYVLSVIGGGGSSDGVLTAATYNADTDLLTLTTSAPSSFNVNLSHVHKSTAISHPTTSVLIRDIIPSYPEPAMSEALDATIDDLHKRLAYYESFAYREIITATAAQTNVEMADGAYKVGSNRLSVFVDGVKQYANERAQQGIFFEGSKFLSKSSLHGLGDGTYTLDVAVDGQTHGVDEQTVSITVDNGLGTNITIGDIVNEINTDLTTPAATAVWSQKDAAIYIFSDISGTGSEIDIADGTTGGLLAALKAVSGFQYVDVGGSVTGGTATGLANDTTTYAASVVIDGISSSVNITGSTAQTYTDLISQINLDLTGAVATLDSGNIKITSNSTGTNSTITISDSGLFSSLTTFVRISPPFLGAVYDDTAGSGSIFPSANGPITQITADRDYVETDGAYAETSFGTSSFRFQFNAGLVGGELIEIISEPSFFNM